MPEAPKRRFDPRVVDENYTPPENATPGETLKGQLAASKREGRRLQKHEQDKATAALTNEIKGIKSAHIEELNRSGMVLRRLGHRMGLLHGIAVGMMCAVAIAFSTWLVMKQVVIFNTATQRVNYPNPPEMQVPESNLSYERSPREPADARQ